MITFNCAQVFGFKKILFNFSIYECMDTINCPNYFRKSTSVHESPLYLKKPDFALTEYSIIKVIHVIACILWP